MNREVRDDQHGTITGYVYGCRCDQCRDASRDYYAEYRAAHPDTHVLRPAGVEAIFSAIEQEADLDGLCTATSTRLGEVAGVSRESALWAVHHLVDQGRVRLGQRVGKGGVYEIYLDWAEAAS